MDKLTRIIAFVWVLSLPFYNYSIVGSFSADNLLAPVLLVVIILRIIIGRKIIEPYQINNIVRSVIVAVIYFITHTIGLIFTQQAIFSSAYTIATNMLYFILPILFIRSVVDMKRFNDALIIVAFVASISALLSALGLLELEYSRYAESRIGEDSLHKSIGLFASYGDAGILLSFSLVLVFASRNSSILFGGGSNIKIVFVLLMSLIGIVSMQSRNIVLTIMTVMLSYWMLGRWMKRSRLWYRKFYVMVFTSILGIVIVIALFSGPLLEYVRGIGGTKEAAGTVDARLSQYGFMWDLMKGRFMLGISSEMYEKYTHEIFLIHNMWLKEIVQGGIITFAAMFFVWWHALTVQVNNYRRGIVADEARGYIAVLLGMLVATQFYPGGTQIFWTILGVCTAKAFGDVGKNIKLEGKSATNIGRSSRLIARDVVAK